MKGLGNDIIETERILEAIEIYGDKFLTKIFTEKEKAYCQTFIDSHAKFAGRFAGKEAIAKALGVGFGRYLRWQDIEILNDKSGKPIVYLSQKVSNHFKNPHILLSISHCKKFACAVAVWSH